MDSRPRNGLFSTLKPACVDLIQATVNFGSKRADAKAVVRSLDVLLEILNRDAQSLDSTLGDYVFYPLSHVFRQSQLLPERAVELALNCLDILLSNCWNQNVSGGLAEQLTILLTFIAGGRPAQVGSIGISEELKVAAFRCLTSLFKSMVNPKTKGWPTDTANLPTLGHAVTVILDAIVDGGSLELQLDALAALEAFRLCVEKETLAGVLPGVVSSLTKCLRLSTSTRRSYKVLERGLRILSAILKSVLADSQTGLAFRGVQATSQLKGDEPQLNDSFLKASAPQIKLALASVVKLRSHEKSVVRHALLHLCLVVLEDCRQSLSPAAGVMVETLIVLSADNSLEGQLTLRRLASVDYNTVDLIQSSMHKWMVALPRLMQSNDDGARRSVIKQLSTSFCLLSELGVQSKILENTMAAALRDSVSSGLQARSKQLLVQQTDELFGTAVDQLPLMTSSTVCMSFQPLLLSHKSQEGTLQDLELFLQQLGRSGSSLIIVRELLDHIRNASGDDFLASFWLSLKLLKNASEENLLLEDLVYAGSSAANVRTQLTEELYSLALGIFSGPADDNQMDWRLHGLALEALALEAQQLGRGFRMELVDALYPLVNLIGSSNEGLRSHAFTALNITARSCGYVGVSNLLVDNVDYLVNAVSLKLNTLDVSPQAPKVLLMMVKLTGPPLLPFLDDLVGSIFAALDNFHGYPRLVALLFSVLEGIVGEGSKSIAVALRSGTEVTIGKSSAQAPTISQLCAMLGGLKRRVFKPPISAEVPASEEFPRRPWRHSDGEGTLTDAEAGGPLAQPEDTEGAPPTTNKVYQMVKKIARFGQHYLTHESPVFRRQLLNLLTTACDALCSNENEFLPLINDIWPVTIKRLYDSEHFVVVAAAETICQICRCAGDFMSSRIHSEWRDIKLLYWNTHHKLQRGARQSGIGTFTPSNQVRNALIGLLAVVVEHVRIDDDMFDDILDMLSDVLERRRDIQDVLSLVNADAVWLVTRTFYGGAARNPPRVDGFAFEPVTGCGSS
ncbi:hypothetical protein FGG08_006338 [Glutinoglossum americanum]|uniref:HEAT repeat protein n=1 Tax=Glutinoglossum americanum TaxID=1670608 RepID=A0A9P8I1F8_9PEZI|nr:hypothetical protein FGG08_006338 [Glutinoglossum americanum]